MSGDKNKDKGKVHKGGQTSDHGIAQDSRTDSQDSKNRRKGPPENTDNYKGVRQEKPKK